VQVHHVILTPSQLPGVVFVRDLIFFAFRFLSPQLRAIMWPFNRPNTVDVPVAEVQPHHDDGLANSKSLEAGDTHHSKAIKPGHTVVKTTHPVDTDSDSETIQADTQDGVKGIEAITTVWSKSHLIAAYIMYKPPLLQHNRSR
jgi:hypothetical protein